MKIGQTQHLNQGQSLTLTPKLQQSIQILQMPTLELAHLIYAQILENPFLQVQEFPQTTQPSDSENIYEDPDLSELQSEVYSNFWTDVGGKNPRQNAEDYSNWVEETVTRPISLKDHLRVQLEAKTTDPHTLFIGLYLIDLVEESGLIQADMEEVARELGVKVLDVLAVLSLLQSFDPVGVCARSLKESLAIQLSDKNILTATMARILHQLKDLPEKGAARVAKAAKVSQLELKEALRLIRAMNPRPGEGFQPVLFESSAIDVFIVRDHSGGWRCELNEEALPKIYADSELYHTLKSKKLRGGDAAYLSAQMSAANWFIKAVHQRSQTILKVCQAIISHQEDFFEKGPCALKPMGLRDLALELGIHESTVSRSINHKYLQTSWGIFELKYFFGSTVKHAGTDQSNRSIQAMIKKLIFEEDKQAPLSDDQLVLILQNKGITVARRTVAKYREALKIPSSFSRKKQAQLMTF